MNIKDPIIIDPPGETPARGWKECSDYVEKCSGMVYEDGEVNIRAAHGADPGVNAGKPDPPYVAKLPRAARARLDQLHQDRLSHPYYRYGFEHPVEDAWAEHDKLPWKEIMGSIAQ